MQPDPLTEERIRSVLNDIIDPCSVAARAPAGLDDMGLVGSVEIRPGADGATVSVTIGTTHPFCMMAAIFMNEANRRIGELAGVRDVNIALDHGEIWTPSRMKPHYREQLEALQREGPVPAAHDASY